MNKAASIFSILIAGLLAGFVVSLIPWPSLEWAGFALGMDLGIVALAAGWVVADKS